MRVTIGIISLLALVAAAASAHGQANRAGVDFFESKVRPILVEECFACHSSASKPLMGGLRLDTRAAFARGAAHGPLVKPGAGDQPLLLKVVSWQDPDLKMPPRGKMAAEKLAILAEWVRLGAPWPEEKAASPSVRPRAGGLTPAALLANPARHWAFAPLHRPPIPRVRDKAWVRSPVDAFILSRLEAAGLAPAPQADRRTLIRRVTFDLTGLPPTPAEIRAFLNDHSPKAWAKVVDRLLASPRYGERWARHWLDLVRYAETDGHEFDFDKPGAWEYRDYVIRALNSDVPYNQFVREHVAGDLLPHPRRNPQEGFNESIIATGFWYLGEGKHSPVDLLVDEAERVDNQIDVFSRAFLGLSLGCARCHDHKFDPLTQKDYYALSGFVKGSRYRLADVQPEVAGRAAASIAEVNARLRPFAIVASAARASARAGRIGDRMERESRGQPPAWGDRAEAAWQLRMKAAAGDPRDPLHAWAALAAGDGSRTPEGFARARDALRLRLDSLEAAAGTDSAAVVTTDNFLSPGFPGWWVDGPAFGRGPAQPGDRLIVSSGQAELAPPAEKATANSGVISDRLQGALRSATFVIPRQKALFRMRGIGGQVRLVIDGFQRIRDPIYGGLEISVNTGDRFKLFAMDVGKWVGHRAYVEILDQGAGWIEVESIRFADHEPALPPHPLALLFARDKGIRSLGDLASRYRAALESAVPVEASRVAAIPAALSAWLLSGDPLFTALDSGARLADAPDSRISSLIRERAALESALQSPRRVIAMSDGSPEEDRVHIRGNPKQLSDPAPRRFLQICGGGLPRYPAGDSCGRLGLAERMTSASNPLLARVMVNRVWYHHFDQGIVRTPDDFGVRGERPTHPELLDWLATEFIYPTHTSIENRKSKIENGMAPNPPELGGRGAEQRRTSSASQIENRKSKIENGLGWSLKALHRLILLSSAYRMSSLPTPLADHKDPANRLLHRREVHRLEAEAIRDSILAVSGRLDGTMYGAPVAPYLTSFMEGRGRPAASGPLDGAGRRSIYLGVRRNFLNPLFLAFDFPVPFNTIGRRSVSNVPAQALALMNNPFVAEQARVWAIRVTAQPGLTDRQRIDTMYETAFGRLPTLAESADALAFLAERRPAGDPQAWTDFAHVLLNVKEFIFVN